MTVALASLRALESLHGVLGIASVAASIVAAVLSTSTRARFVVPVVLATLVVTLTGALGLFLYPSYTRLLKRAIYVASRADGVLFERKEHLAVAVVALAWAGCIAYVTSPRERQSALSRARFARWSFVASALIAIFVAVFGIIVAAVRSF